MEIRVTCQPAEQVHYVEPARRTQFSLAIISVNVQFRICVLGYIAIVQHKEISPEICQIPPGTPCIYTGCPKRKVQYFGRVFLRSNYTDITQNTYIQSSMVMEKFNIEK